MTLKHHLFALCAAASVFGAARADDAVVYTFAGVVDFDEGDRGWTTFTGQFTFDRTATDQIADASTADYKSNGSPYGMNVVFDGSVAVGLDSFIDILITNDLGGTDQFGAQAQAAGSNDSLGLTLTDFTQGVFAGDSLPLPSGGLTLAMFSVSAFMYESGGALLSGHLTGLTCDSGCDVVAMPVTPVPEPATWALTLAGLGAIGFACRRPASTTRSSIDRLQGPQP